MDISPNFLNMNNDILKHEDKPCSDLFAGLHTDYFPYYRSWCHDVPIFISTQRDQEIRTLQEILYRCCAFYTEHYMDYLDVIPYEDKVLKILDHAANIPFRAGTFRPDYVIREDGSILVCEITSRFFGNGYFMSYFMEAAGEEFAKEAKVTDRRSYFEDFFEYMASFARGYSRMFVLKSADKSDSIKLYVPFYQALGLDVKVLEADEVEDNIQSMKGGLIISALNQNDLLSYSMDTLKTLADQGMRNDFRTVFLLHDKRFFYLFFKDSFTDRFLDAKETLFLRSHVIPTYLYGFDMDRWEDARKNKDGYIIKHHCLGKSEKVYAGSLTDSDKWDEMFEEGQISSMILQPFIKQKIFSAGWQGSLLHDYLSPSILCVDDRYFGTALFRTSSCPVINQADAHKVAPVLSDQAYKFPGCHIL